MNINNVKRKNAELYFRLVWAGNEPKVGGAPRTSQKELVLTYDKMAMTNCVFSKANEHRGY